MKWDILKCLQKRGVKPGLLIAALVLVLCLSVGGSLAYFAVQTGEFENLFGVASAEIKVYETFNAEKTEKSEIYIKNLAKNERSDSKEPIAVYVRATVVCNWQDGNGNVVAKFDELPTLPTTEVDGLGTNWVFGPDGYYYYIKVLQPGEQTEKLFTVAITDASTSSHNYTLTVTIHAEAIQASGENDDTLAVVDAWGSAVESVDANGILTITEAE